MYLSVREKDERKMRDANKQANQSVYEREKRPFIYFTKECDYSQCKQTWNIIVCVYLPQKPNLTVGFEMIHGLW